MLIEHYILWSVVYSVFGLVTLFRFIFTVKDKDKLNNASLILTMIGSIFGCLGFLLKKSPLQIILLDVALLLFFIAIGLYSIKVIKNNKKQKPTTDK